MNLSTKWRKKIKKMVQVRWKIKMIGISMKKKILMDLSMKNKTKRKMKRKKTNFWERKKLFQMKKMLTCMVSNLIKKKWRHIKMKVILKKTSNSNRKINRKAKREEISSKMQMMKNKTKDRILSMISLIISEKLSSRTRKKFKHQKKKRNWSSKFKNTNKKSSAKKIGF